MILYRHEQAEKAPLALGTRWDYKGPQFDQMPSFGRALTLQHMGQFEGQAIVKFAETNNARYSQAMFDAYFDKAGGTHELAIADALLKTDWRNPKQAEQARMLGAYAERLYRHDRAFGIFSAVMRAQSFGTGHITGLDEGEYAPTEVWMDNRYEMAIPRTDGEWQVTAARSMQTVRLHRFISEREAKAIAGIYKASGNKGAAATKSNTMALRPGNAHGTFIPRSVGDSGISLSFDAGEVADYELSGISLDEAQCIAWETYKIMSGAGVAFTYTIS